MQKNVASQKLIVFAFDSTTNLPKTGDAANITAYVSIDYGTVTILADTSATEMSSTLAKGYYLFDLAQAETNGNTLLFSANSTTSNIVVIGVPATVFTDPANYTAFSLNASGQVDVIKLNGTSQTARDIGASVLLSSGTGTGQLNFTTGVVNSNATQIAGQTASAAGAVTFPGTIASPTNITAGTITTVTNLTNAPTVGDFTATMKTSITTAATASSPTLDWSKVTNQSSTVVLSNTLVSETVNVNNILTGGITNASFAGGVLPTNFGILAIDGSGFVTYNNAAPSSAAAIATAVWTDTTASDFTTAGSPGISVFTGVAPGAANGLVKAGSNASITTTNLVLGAMSIGGNPNVAQSGDTFGSLPAHFSALIISAGGRVSTLQNAQKNTALAGYEFQMASATAPYGPAAGLTVAGEVSKDGGAFGALTNAVSEVGGGTYTIDLAAADLNANVSNLQFIATGAFQVNNVIITTP